MTLQRYYFLSITFYVSLKMCTFAKNRVAMKQICPKCGNTKFQLTDIDITNCPYGYMAVSCTNCNYPIGIVNYENIPATTIKYGKEILDKIEKLEKAIEIKK